MSKKWSPEKWRGEFPGLVAVSTTLGHALSSSLVAEEHWTPDETPGRSGIEFRRAEQLVHGVFYVELGCRPDAADRSDDFTLKLSFLDLGVFQSSSKFKPSGALKLVAMEYKNSAGKVKRLIQSPLGSQLKFLGLEFFILDDSSLNGWVFVVRETTPEMGDGVRVMLKRELKALKGTTVEFDSDLHWYSDPRSFEVFGSEEFKCFGSYVRAQAKAKGRSAQLQLLLNSREHGIPVSVPSSYPFE